MAVDAASLALAASAPAQLLFDGVLRVKKLGFCRVRL